MSRPRILVLAKTMPLHDRASGDYRLSRVLEIFARGGFDVDFLSTTHVGARRATGRLEYVVRDSVFRRSSLDLLDQRYIDDLARVGVRTLNAAEPAPFAIRPGSRFDIRPYLREKAYDLIWVEFYYLLDEYIDDLRRFQPGARVVCDSVDLHFRRLARQCNFLEDQARYAVNSRHERRRADSPARRERLADQRRHADHVRDVEIRAYQKCDAVVMVSEDDRQELRRFCPHLPLLLVPNIHKRPSGSEGPVFAKRSGCVFIGNFDHDPNVSSCVFLKHEVAPRLEGIRFRLVGSNPPKIVRTMTEHGPAADRIEVTGWVPDTKPYLDAARVSVAPILFGAGMNGKIGEAMIAGVPVVTTSLGALGMGLEHEKTCLVADDPAAFAADVRRLHDDERLWKTLRANALRHVETLYSERGVEQELLAVAKSLLPARRAALPRIPPAPAVRLALPAFPNPPPRPKFSVIVLAHNQWHFTELCLRALAHAEKKHGGLAEFLLVDNASGDGTPDFAERIPNLRVLRQAENLGFAGGNNAGIAQARGENVVLLNNDVVVTPSWLARLGTHVDAIPDLGIIGPTTNTETGQRLPELDYGSLGELFALEERLASGAWERVRKVSGLCMVIPRVVLDRLGPLDTEFGLGYFEDDDLCLRAEDLGLKIVWAKDVFVHHFGSVSFSRKRARFLEEGMAKFAFKWGKRGLEHIAKQHRETLLRARKPRSFSI